MLQLCFESLRFNIENYAWENDAFEIMWDDLEVYCDFDSMWTNTEQSLPIFAVDELEAELEYYKNLEEQEEAIYRQQQYDMDTFGGCGVF